MQRRAGCSWRPRSSLPRRPARPRRGGALSCPAPSRSWWWESNADNEGSREARGKGELASLQWEATRNTGGDTLLSGVLSGRLPVDIDIDNGLLIACRWSNRVDEQCRNHRIVEHAGGSLGVGRHIRIRAGRVEREDAV